MTKIKKLKSEKQDSSGILYVQKQSNRINMNSLHNQNNKQIARKMMIQ